MLHPLERLTSRQAARLYWLLLAATFVLGGLLQAIGARYANLSGPDGDTYDVIAFEFATTPQRAQHMLSVWGAEGTRAAVLQTLIDYAFLLTYSNAIALGILLIVGRLDSRRSVVRLGRVLAWGQWAAALLDALENSALLLILTGWPVSPWPQIAAGCAGLKFLLVFAGILFILVGVALREEGKNH